MGEGKSRLLGPARRGVTPGPPVLEPGVADGVKGEEAAADAGGETPVGVRPR
jgi:hypothetical protein